MQERKRYAAAELGRIIALRETYATEDLLAAIEHAHRYAAYGAKAVERILQAHATPRTFEDHLAAKAREHIRRSMAQAPVKQRDLDAYARLLSGPVSTEDAHREQDDDPPEEGSP